MRGTYAVKRANPRFPFFAEAELTLRDGSRVSGQLAELSSRGCYIDTIEPIPVQTKVGLSIHDGFSTCDLQGKVIYLHSGPGLGIFGMGVLFENLRGEQSIALDAWLRQLGRRHTPASADNSSLPIG
jgi:PilZ domain